MITKIIPIIAIHNFIFNWQMKISIISEIGNGLLQLIYPPICEGCNRILLPSEIVLCMGCKLKLPETGYHNHKENETSMRFAGRFQFEQATTFGYFTHDGLLQHLLHGLKYQGKKEIGLYLGRQLALSLQSADWIKTLDIIIPVPLHKKKKWKRGYNQSMLIAEGISNILQIPANDNLLIRLKHTESQTQKSRAERLHNMEKAFGISDWSKLKNKHILLVDDVLTTGATIEACALALLKEETIKISIATIGIAI